MKKKEYAITLSVCATMFVEASSPEEAEEIALNDFERSRDALVFSIDTNGYEAEYDDGLTEEYEEDYDDEDESV